MTNRMNKPNDAGTAVNPAGDAVQSAWDSTEIHALVAGMTGTGIVSGGDVTMHGAGGRFVDVAIATIEVLHAPLSITAGTLAFGANATALRRLDAVVARAGALLVLPGTPADPPCLPVLARNADGEVTDVLYAAVLCDPGFTDLATEKIVQLGVAPASGGAGSGGAAPIVFEPIQESSGTHRYSYNGVGWINDYTFTDLDANGEISGNHDGSIYGLWIGPGGHPLMGKRGPLDKFWTIYDLGSVAGNPLGAPVTPDIHYYVTFGMDSEGRIHVVGNTHVQPLQYMRTTGGYGDLSSWSGALSMTGQNEDHVTFPQFFRMPDETLIFVVAQAGDVTTPNACPGGPDDARFSMKRWKTATHTWEELGGSCALSTPAITAFGDAHADGANMFAGNYTIDPNSGDLHLGFTYRYDDSVSLGRNWYYVRVEGLGLTDTRHGAGGTVAVFDSAGSARTLPIGTPIEQTGTQVYSAGHMPTKIATLPSKNLLSNIAGVQLTDKNGFPHWAFLNIEGTIGTTGIVQQVHIWKDASVAAPVGRAAAVGWHCAVVTDFTNQGADWSHASSIKGGYATGSGTRMQIVPTADGRVFGLLNWPTDGMDGALWCYDLTNLALDPLTGEYVSVPQPFKLHELPDQHDFHWDAYLAFRTGLLRMMIIGNQRFYRDPGNPAEAASESTYVPPSFYSSNALELPGSLLGLCTIDLAQMGAFAARQVQLPRIESVALATGGNITLTAPALAALGTLITGTNQQQANLVVSDRWRGSLLFCRVLVEQYVDVGWVASCIQANCFHETTLNDYEPAPDPASGFYACVINLPGDSRVHHTSWVGLPIFDFPGGAVGNLLAFGAAKTGSTGTIALLTIELGVLRN